ncbi:MAG TPA: hypothetical protein VN841_02555 [Bryobacteraceae bacterium]|nr:hypothetical protein [Bryobacteraceae bacterium]
MPNQWTRASFVRMFLLGRGVINISRHHRVAPAAVETELREELIRGGALDRVQTFRRAA